MELDGLKIAIIGGASGVGRGIAETCHAHGAQLVVADRLADQSAPWPTVEVDLLKRDRLSGLSAAVQANLGTIDWLVITIGGIDSGPLLELDQNRWQWMFESNVIATMNAVGSLADTVQDGGKIVLSGSGSGFAPPDAESSLGAYCVMKHAVLGLYRSLRSELAARSIDVVLMLPSAVAGRLAQNSADDRYRAGVDASAVLRAAQPPDRKLQSSLEAAETMLDQLLSGRPIISNDLNAMSRKLRDGYEELAAALNSEFRR